ncbi:uncharacterized protein LOC115477889 [Microcaecilia unicolor]|uniref:Uncharacterized protein LOC115477889 n=1 Tax=Microcaecilia unicolor TaxID=1415580 RepID=A0A6P7Z0X7_9AMPH|nr:uncharacterized protein LOC115477889 [Microcaecilia unicolor]
MTAVDLEHLLARFNLRRKDGMVHYVRFIGKLQSRSSLSLLHRMLENLIDRIHQDKEVLNNASAHFKASEAEYHLLELCQGVFLKVLARFRKADVWGKGSVTRDDFREITEKMMQIQLEDDQILVLVDAFGEPASNTVSYIKFLSFFQGRPTTAELKEEVERLSSLITVRHRLDKIRYRKSIEMDLSRYTHEQKSHSLQELQTIIWDLLQHKLWPFCNVFLSVCKNTDCTADKEKLDAILQRMNVNLLPEEFEKLWHSLPVSCPQEAISLRKLLYYFAKFKKPKDNVPKDVGAVALIQNKLSSKIIKQWKEVKSIIKARDPKGNGQVSFTEICALFLALKLDITPAELDTLCQTFDLNQDGNFHYLPFLKFYLTTPRQLNSEERRAEKETNQFNIENLKKQLKAQNMQ